MLNIAQIGAGRFGIHHVKILAGARDARLAMVCDPAPESRNRARELAPKAKICESSDDLFSDDSIKAVVVATPAQTHAGLAMRALRAGKHCFVEKPLALEAAAAGELVEEAAKRKLVLMVGHLLLYHPAYAKLIAMTQAGELGRIRYLQSVRVNLGTVRSNENALWSLAPHDLSTMLRIVGKDPVAVSATGAAFLQKKIHDVVFFTLHFGDGALAQGHVSWLDPRKLRVLTVVGDERMAVLDDLEPVEKLRLHDRGVVPGAPPSVRDGPVTPVAVEPGDPLKAELEDFIRCAAGGKTPRSDGLEGLRVVRVLETLQRSLEKGGPPVEMR